jgi:multiple antibiotic resistance protein
MDTAFAVKFFGAFFAVVNALAALPIFLSLTQGLTPAEQKKTALTVTLYSTIICAVVALGGQQILGFFGISLDQFRVAGGILLAGIALSMVSGAGSPAHEGSSAEQAQQGGDAIAFYPMAFPIVAGPGVIATLILFSHEATTDTDRLTFWAVIAANMAILLVLLYFAGAIGKRLTATLRVIMLRLMGMIVLAIAIGMITTGLKAIFPGLAA